jgi:hypothetical protein
LEPPGVFCIEQAQKVIRRTQADRSQPHGAVGSSFFW